MQGFRCSDGNGRREDAIDAPPHGHHVSPDGSAASRLDGIEVTRRVKSRRRVRATSVIAVTAVRDERAIARAMKAAATATTRNRSIRSAPQQIAEYLRIRPLPGVTSASGCARSPDSEDRGRGGDGRPILVVEDIDHKEVFRILTSRARTSLSRCPRRRDCTGPFRRTQQRRR